MIDWLNEDWSYMLGVLHGDGSIAPRSIDVAVGYRDADYAEVLIDTWRRLGYEPKVYRPKSALKIAVHSTNLRHEFAPYKANGKWQWPETFSVAHYLSGVIDTDGHVTLPKNCSIVITLKRSGNLKKLAEIMRQWGITNAYVREATTTYGGQKEYEIEDLKVHKMENILILAEHLRLRHPRKARRLVEMRAYVAQVLAQVPMWKQVAAWLTEEPRTWEDIANRFNLTKAQVDSIMILLKKNTDLEVIPPPKLLTRYRVRSLTPGRLPNSANCGISDGAA